MGNIDSKAVVNFKGNKILKNKKKLELVEPVLTDNQIEALQESWGILKHDISRVGVVMFMKNFNLMMGGLECKVFVSHKEKHDKKNLPILSEPTLSETDIKNIEESWKLLRQDISKVGVVMFMNLFQTHPEVQDAFLPFQQLAKEDMEHSAILRSHALRVMGTVDKCLARIRTPEKLQNLMHELGERHANYSARQEFIDLVGSQFVYAIKPHLEDCWSKELEEAWLQLFRVMSFHMKKGMRESNVITY